MTFRRCDEREVSLREVSLREVPMVELLNIGETVRAEEIALETPDGRRVTALLNATPIHSDDGAVESMIVTLEESIVRAFDMGAVDYVVKPFSPTELAAGIRSALRRRTMAEPSEPYVLGDLTMDYSEHRVTISGRPIHLTPTEHRMLAELSVNAGHLLTHQRLLDRAWGEKDDGDVRPMRTIVGKLRHKLGDDADNPRYIFTEPRVGWRMSASN